MVHYCKNPCPCNATFLRTNVLFTLVLLSHILCHYCTAVTRITNLLFFCPGTSHIVVAYTKFLDLLPSFCYLRLHKTAYSNFYPLHLYSSVPSYRLHFQSYLMALTYKYYLQIFFSESRSNIRMFSIPVWRNSAICTSSSPNPF
jgi:hypothetical protein